jgi:phage-related baseplate assembly protein
VTSDPAVKVLEVVAYREMLIRQQFNERARQVMLAYATGSNLDQLGALLDVGRLAGEADTAYRARIQLAPEAFSVAGPASAYRFYALSAAPTIADASVPRPGPTISARWSWGVWPRKGPGPIWSRRWRPRSMRWSGRAR